MSMPNELLDYRVLGPHCVELTGPTTSWEHLREGLEVVSTEYERQRALDRDMPPGLDATAISWAHIELPKPDSRELVHPVTREVSAGTLYIVSAGLTFALLRAREFKTVAGLRGSELVRTMRSQIQTYTTLGEIVGAALVEVRELAETNPSATHMPHATTADLVQTR